MPQIKPIKRWQAKGDERRPSFGWLCCGVRRACRQLGPQEARKRAEVCIRYAPHAMALRGRVIVQ